MRAHLLPLADVSDRDLGAWRELAASAVEPNPFFEPDLVLPAWRHLGPEHVGLLVAENGGGWAACMPVHKPSRWRRLPIPALAAWRHSYCYLGTPLARSDQADAALAALVDRGLQERRAGALTLDWLGDGGPVAASLARVAEQGNVTSACYERFERAALHRRREPTYLAETLRGHHRRELQRLRRALGREVGELVAVTDRSDDPAAVEDFLRLEASGWKGGRGTALASRAGHAGFFRDVCAGFALEGRLQLLALSAGERTVALKCNLVAAGAVFCFKIGYDDRYARFSPGLQLERDTVGLFHDRADLTSMDSCADPDNEMINRLWPDRRPIATFLLAGKGARGLAARHGTAAAATLRDRVRRVQWKTS